MNGADLARLRRMATIHLEKPHHLGRDEAARRLHELEPELARKYGVKLNWGNGGAAVKASGLTGEIAVSEATVSIDLNLGLKLRLLAGRIKNELDKTVAKALA
jgi:putative polyhydroxyalkanoate system protein